MIKQAMILAAGRGERLRPLTDYVPKPLLQVGGETLIGRHLVALARAGITRVIVNTSWRGDLLQRWLGDGRAYGVEIRFSDEGDQALETGGGICNALPLLEEAPFLVINGDVWTDLDFSDVHTVSGDDLANLVLVNNPQRNRDGDFGLDLGRVIVCGPQLTFAGISVLSPRLFEGQAPGRFSVVPLLRNAIDAGQVAGQHFAGVWFDTGTPDSLADARACFAQTKKSGHVD